MSIHPIVKTVTVKATPQKAFDVFTNQTALWWRKGTTMGKHPHQAIVIEPKVDGRWFERDADGKEIQWGKVLVWQPVDKLVLAWQINTNFQYDPALISEVEITFAPAGEQGTIVTLEHRNLERLGAGAEKFIAMMDAGWASHVVEYGAYVNAQI